MTMTSEIKSRGLVEIDGVGMTYRRNGAVNEALAATTMTLDPGSFTSLVGPSGCGKSTLLNVLGGFIHPTAGAATLDGQQIVEPGPERGVVFQSYALFPWFTALRNVEFALERHGFNRKERRERAHSYLKSVGLAGGADKYPSELSGGMQQRVALARALAAAPTLLLMDEPFGALDATTRQTMQTLLLEIWERERTTVLFVTHDVDEALYLSDTIHVMSPTPGRVISSFHNDAPRPRALGALTPEQLEARKEILALIHSNY